MLSKTLVKLNILLFLLKFTSISYAQDDCHALLKAGHLSQALASVRLTLKANPNQVDLWQCQGRAHGLLGQYQEGMQALSQAKQLAKSRNELLVTHLLLGNLQLSQRAYDAAIAEYQTSLGIAQAENNRPLARKSYHLLGDANLAKKQHQEALQHYQSASGMDMNDNERAESYANIALAHQGLHQLDQAIEFQRKTVVMQQKSGTLDDYADASLQLGHYFAQNEQYQHAERTYQKLLQFSLDNGGDYYTAKTHVYLAQMKRAQTNHAEALHHLVQAKTIADKLNVPALSKLIEDTEKSTQ